MSAMNCAVLLTVLFATATFAQNIRVMVWDERQPKQKEAYENFVGNQIANHLRALPGITVIRSAGLDDPEHGLGGGVLEQCDVLIWWGHIRQDEIPVEIGKAIVETKCRYN